jgi:hypothetical protein
MNKHRLKIEDASMFQPVLGSSHFFVKTAGSDYHNHFKKPLRFSLYKKEDFDHL